jgi:hypothetical protein
VCAQAAAFAFALAASALAQAPATTPPPADQTAPPAEATPPAEAAPPADAATPATPQPDAARGVAAPPAGKTQVVFFRPRKFQGSILSFSVREGDTGIGRLGNGEYFVHVTDPGVHEFNIQSEATDTLRLELEEGQTYFVQQVIEMGIMVGRPVMTPSDRVTFEAKPLELSTREGVDRQRRRSRN